MYINVYNIYDVHIIYTYRLLGVSTKEHTCYMEDDTLLPPFSSAWNQTPHFFISQEPSPTNSTHNSTPAPNSFKRGVLEEQKILSLLYLTLHILSRKAYGVA